MHPPERILIIQTAFIGDVILATALLEKLHRFFPDARIDFLLRKGNESLFRDHPFLNQLVIWDKKQKKYRNLFSLIRRLRRERYDLVVNLQRFFATGLITWLSRGKLKLGFDKNPFSFATRSIPHRFGDGTHEVERNLQLIESLTDESFQKPRLYPNEEDFQQFQADQPYVCMAPTSVWFTKQWPAEKWVELIDRIPAHISIYLLGAPSDQHACEKIKNQSHHARVESLAGKLSLLASAALMSKAMMNYVNDSAPLHLASAMDAPVTAIFCSTIPAFGFFPLSSQSKVVETATELDCRPCGMHGHKACPQGHFRCSEISIDRLLPDAPSSITLPPGQ
jgi:lipopolysaccharide heptosyltransferase II